MKRFLLAISVLVSFNICSGQITAQDWTKTDCDGGSHHLFGDLDAGIVVMMDFIHVGCIPCIMATTYLDQIQKDFEISHPGRVKMILMSYDNVTSCATLNSWKSTYNFNEPMIPNCEAELNYYGGMGMPTIAIAGGADHTLFFRQLGFSSSDDPKVRAAIVQALAASVGVEEPRIPNGLQIEVYSASESITVHITGAEKGQLELHIYNLSGVKIHSVEGWIYGHEFNHELDISKFSKGMYLIQVVSGKQETVSEFFIQH